MKFVLARLKKELKKSSDLKRANVLRGFFKTGKGEYGEGDVFLGLTAEEIKNVAKKYYQNANYNDWQILLKSKIHEERMVALRMLILKYQKGNFKEKEKIFNFYLKNAKKINNWDLVDVSAPKIVGDYLLNKPRSVLYKLARSNNLWERRIAILATFAFIRNNEFEDTLKIAKILLNDKHDLIHKAAGWMLREVGNRNQEAEEEFLKKYYLKMPGTMLRYAIEKFDKKKRKFYLNKINN